MKEHISITIEHPIIKSLKSYAMQEKRSVSQVAEMAIEEFLYNHSSNFNMIYTTSGSFKGKFSRIDTYERD